MKRTILLGKGDLAVHAAEWFFVHDMFKLDAVVPVIPEPDWTGSLLSWARTRDVPVVETGDYADLSTVIGPDRFELVVSIFYDRIIRAEFIRRCDRIINLHNAPLPRYRGVSPINWALKNDERMHGVTLHEITPGIDDGPIVAQTTFSIFPELDEVQDVYHRALRYGRVLFETTMPLIDSIVPVPQEASLATYYSRKDDERLGERRGFTRQASS